MADAIAITKTDGDNKAAAQRAMVEYQNALHMVRPSQNDWLTPVLACSALEKTGLRELWATIEKYEKQTKNNGFFDQNRQSQHINWLYDYIRQSLENSFFENLAVNNQLQTTLNAVREGTQLPIEAAESLLNLYRGSVVDV
jgi:LAO/AO transport system kinase